MSDWREGMGNALSAFTAVAGLAGSPIPPTEITVEYMTAPHRPPSRLPPGKMAVYGFWGNGTWLKIGKAGPNSHARYASHHYSPGRALNTLAGSLVGDPRMRTVPNFDPRVPGDWIKTETHRVNILLPSHKPKELLSLLEAFLHLRLRPRYEG